MRGCIFTLKWKLRFVWTVVTDGACFTFCKEFYAVCNLCFVLTTHQGSFCTAEWQVWHGSWNAYVNANHTGVGVTQEVLCNDCAFGKQAAAVAVLGVVDDLHTVFIGFNFNQCNHRTKDFFFCYAHVWSNAFQNGWSDEITVFEFFRQFWVTAV